MTIPENLEKKFESVIEKKLIAKSKRKKIEDGFKNNKVINEVLDKSTILTLYDLIKSKISSIEIPSDEDIKEAENYKPPSQAEILEIKI